MSYQSALLASDYADSVEERAKDAKKLGIKEDATPDQVDAAVYKKKAEATKKYLKSKKTEKDIEVRDKELAEI